VEKELPLKFKRFMKGLHITRAGETSQTLDSAKASSSPFGASKKDLSTICALQAREEFLKNKFQRRS